MVHRVLYLSRSRGGRGLSKTMIRIAAREKGDLHSKTFFLGLLAKKGLMEGKKLSHPYLKY